MDFKEKTNLVAVNDTAFNNNIKLQKGQNLDHL